MHNGFPITHLQLLSFFFISFISSRFSSIKKKAILTLFFLTSLYSKMPLEWFLDVDITGGGVFANNKGLGKVQRVVRGR